MYNNIYANICTIIFLNIFFNKNTEISLSRALVIVFKIIL